MSKKIYAVLLGAEVHIPSGASIQRDVILIRGETYEEIRQEAKDKVRTMFPPDLGYYNHRTIFTEIPLQWCIDAVRANLIVDID